MIISISGKKGSGKDLVAVIIQALIIDNTRSSTSEESNNLVVGRVLQAIRDGEDINKTSLGLLLKRSGWGVKRFAERLKQMACLLIGCTRDQLEDREFKNKDLGDVWAYTRELAGHDGVMYEERLTPRKILQLLGTRGVRDSVHPNAWVNSLMSEYKQDTIVERSEEELIYDYPNWIITDMRFPNELKEVESKGGITIRLERPDIPSDDHVSETALDEAEFDYVIENSGTIEDLIDMVKQLLKNEKIID